MDVTTKFLAGLAFVMYFASGQAVSTTLCTVESRYLTLSELGPGACGCIIGSTRYVACP